MTSCTNSTKNTTLYIHPSVKKKHYVLDSHGNKKEKTTAVYKEYWKDQRISQIGKDSYGSSKVQLPSPWRTE